MMFGYGALLNSDLANKLGTAWGDFIRAIMEAPVYWHIAAAIGLFACYRALTKN